MPHRGYKQMGGFGADIAGQSQDTRCYHLPPDRIQIAFDDHRLAANAGLLLPIILAHHLGLGELVDRHVHLGDAPGCANAGDKVLTLVASALAGGDCIDDADALRAGETERVLGCVVKAPSHAGHVSAEFPVGPCAAVGSGEP